MYQKVARIVAPMAATFAVAAVGAGSRAAGGAPARQPGTSATTACPAEVTPHVPAIPGASPSGAGVNPPSLKLALTAHGVRMPEADAIEYRISARPTRAPLHDITVTVRLTCVPGTVWAAGGPWASTGQAALERRAVTWRLDLGKAPATAGFAVRLRPNSRGGPLVGEVVAAGPVSNCPALRAADTAIDPSCRAIILIPGEPATAARPRHPALVRPAVPAPPAGQGGPPIAQGPPPAFPHVPVMPPVPPAGAAPGSAHGNDITGPGAPPVVPAPAPSPTVLSQLDRAPIVPGDPAGDVTRAPVPPASVLRSGETSGGGLSGRAFALLIGGMTSLLIATAVMGGLIGVRLRPRAGRDVGPRAGRPDGRRPDRLPRTIGDVVRRTAETRDTYGADPAGGRDRP